ncbi:MAG: hypothetical protein ACYTXI_35750 [Nostoc sp.]
MKNSLINCVLSLLLISSSAFSVPAIALMIWVSLKQLTYPNACSCIPTHQDHTLPASVNFFSEITLLKLLPLILAGDYRNYAYLK